MNRIAICLFFVAVSLTVSCQKAPELALLSPSSIDVSADGWTSTIYFYSNCDWIVRSSDSWVTVSPTSGTASEDGNVTVDVNCAANTTYEERSATITIKALNGEIPDQVISIKQLQKDAILIDNASYEMPIDGGEIQVAIQANVQVDVVPDVEWIHYIETKALSNSTVCLSVDKNETYDIREGKILISQRNGSLSYVINVKQAERVAIDLGLPSGLKWAECNIGASRPEEYGDYFAWGEIEKKDYYDWSNYKLCDGTYNTLTKYNTDISYGNEDGKTVLEATNDVAHVRLGGKCRIPTDAEWTELWTNCTWVWITLNGINGMKVTGPNGNSIFLPAAGFYNGTSLSLVGTDGFYWFSYLRTYNPTDALCVDFFYGFAWCIDYFPRYLGMSVRPVYGDVVSVSSVSFDTTSFTMYEDASKALIATVKPDNATDKSVTWSSSNPEVATVSGSGVVTAIKAGSTTITVKTNDGGYTASCSLTVASSSYGEGAVDLGLPSGTKWASCNIGASKPWEYGDYYAWGETETKYDYSWSTYKWCNGTYNSLKKYNTDSAFGTVDNKTILDSTDDVAHVIFGEKWHIPTDTNWDELINKCTWTWTTWNGVYGRMVTGPNGDSIFLPAAGLQSGTDLSGVGTNGFYWSSSLDTSSLYYAWGVDFHSGNVSKDIGSRCDGFSVRPVSE